MELGLLNSVFVPEFFLDLRGPILFNIFGLLVLLWGSDVALRILHAHAKGQIKKFIFVSHLVEFIFGSQVLSELHRV